METEPTIHGNDELRCRQKEGECHLGNRASVVVQVVYRQVGELLQHPADRRLKPRPGNDQRAESGAGCHLIFPCPSTDQDLERRGRRKLAADRQMHLGR